MPHRIPSNVSSKRRSVRPKRLGVASLMTLMAISTGARAQSMDYGALEQLFGEPVTTSATGSPQRQSDVPVNMEIITQDDIRRSGAKDIPGILAHVGSIDIQQWTNNQAEVGVRGYDAAYSQRLLVLVNGRQVYDDIFNYMPWTTLPIELSEIRQIEVVKGPSTALFGFNAVGGVINIITYDPSYDSVNTVSIAAGTQRLVEGSAVATFKVGGSTAFRISGGLRRNDDFSTPVPAVLAVAPRHENNRKTIALDAVVKLGDKARFRLAVNHTEADSNEVVPVPVTDFGRYKISSVSGEITVDSNLGLLRASVYNTWLKELSDPGLFGTLDVVNRVTVAQLADTIKVGSDHTLRASAEYRHNGAETTPLRGGHVFYDVLSAGGMWEWKITPSFTLTNALRFDDLMLGRSGSIPAGFPFTNPSWNRKLTELSFNSGAVWKVGDLDTLRVTASRGAQLPNLLNFGGFLFVSPFFAVSGIPTVKPVEVTNYEIGWDRSFPSLNARSRASVFYQRTTDVITFAGGSLPTPSVVYGVPSNIGLSRAAGLDLALSGTVRENWRWGLSYRLESITDRFEPGPLKADYEHTTPRHLLKGNLGWAEGRWEIDGYFAYQSATRYLLPVVQLGPNILVPVHGYASVDGRIGYKLTDQIMLAVSGQNLTNHTQQQTAGAAVERRVMAKLTVSVP